MDRLSRAEKRLLKQQKRQEQKQNKNNLELRTVTPKTVNQERVFKEFINGKNLLIHGLPGTGKSFISLYLALSEIEEFRDHSSVTIIRSVVPSRDMGFLPGSIKEKSKVYEAPYQAICTELYKRGDAYEILKQKGMLNFETSSFLRGLTLDNTIIIVDECQNMTYQELNTIITRVGNNSKIIFCGDYRQTDLRWDDEKEGIHVFMNILNRMPKYFSCIEFLENDIVRSGLVKDFIIKKNLVENGILNNVAQGHFSPAQALHTPPKDP
jgi:phosphate starvation-inducible protein PhoH and related proteins